MPRRDDLHKILLIGSGPIVIGQAAEFDYSGTQACRVLIEEGYEVVLVNSNPATIMTDPEVASTTYIEPLNPATLAQVIERERPDALLGTLGGQTALNLAKALYEDGTLERYGVELIGANYEAINRAEDRELFRETMTRAGLRVPRSTIAHTLADAEVLFALLLDRLDRAMAPAGAVADLVATTPGRLNVLLADGTSLWATTWGDTLWWRPVGAGPARRAPAAADRRPDGADGAGVVVASEPLDDDPAWTAVPERSLLEATREGDAVAVRVRPLAAPFPTTYKEEGVPVA